MYALGPGFLTAFLADTLLVWNHASYMSGKACCFEQRVLVMEPLCHCDHSDWSDLIFRLRTATKLELPALDNDERKKARADILYIIQHPHDLLYIDQHRSASLPESKKSHWRGKEVGGRIPWNQMRKLRLWTGTLLAQKVGLDLFKVAGKTNVKESLTQFLSEAIVIMMLRIPRNTIRTTTPTDTNMDSTAWDP